MATLPRDTPASAWTHERVLCVPRVLWKYKSTGQPVATLPRDAPASAWTPERILCVPCVLWKYKNLASHRGLQKEYPTFKVILYAQVICCTF